MGNCLGPETPEEKLQADKLRTEKLKSKGIDEVLREDKSHDSQINKLLLLGAGDSGKSTLFKQMRCIYGDGYNDMERKSFHSALCNNIVCCMKVLVKQGEKFAEIEEKTIPLRQQVLDLETNHDDLDEGNVGQNIKTLWADAGIQKTFENAAKFYLTDSAKYFFDSIDRVMAEGYIPSQEDVFRTRIPTTGIVEKKFDVTGHIFQMYDVGGQRSERKKWINCFDNVTSVIFVAALSAYDQVLYEDEKTNRMQESLQLFGQITGMEWFDQIPFILFLNKSDVFQEKLKKVRLADFFAAYEGDNDYNSAAQFIEDLFIETDQSVRDIYPHWTCATNTENMKKVFDVVKDIIIKRGLGRAGLV